MITIAILRAAGLSEKQVLRVLELEQEDRLSSRRHQNRINSKEYRSRQQIAADGDDAADGADDHRSGKKERKINGSVSNPVLTEPALAPLPILSSSSLLPLEDPPEKRKEESKTDGSARERKPRAKTGHPLPDGWQPNQEHRALAVSLGRTVEWMAGCAEAMRCWARAEASRAVTKKSNWDQAFSGWMRRDVARAPSNGGHQNGRPSRSESLSDVSRRFCEAAQNGLDFEPYQPVSGLLPPK